jgi:hypothetical protein
MPLQIPSLKIPVAEFSDVAKQHHSQHLLSGVMYLG